MGTYTREVLVFRSAIGWPAGGLLAALGLVTGSMTLLLTIPTTYTPLAVAVLVLVVAMALWLLVGAVYRIRDGVLTVSSGIRRRRIALADITSAAPWPHSGWQIEGFDDFSLGSKRLVIWYGESSVFVSPKDQAAFLAALGQQGQLADGG